MRIIIQRLDNLDEGFANRSREVRKAMQILRAAYILPLTAHPRSRWRRVGCDRVSSIVTEERIRQCSQDLLNPSCDPTPSISEVSLSEVALED